MSRRKMNWADVPNMSCTVCQAVGTASIRAGGGIELGTYRELQVVQYA